MKTVELLFSPDCPNVPAARVELRRAMEQAGLRQGWKEFDVTSAEAPKRVRGFGSPTILVDGKDVCGVMPSEGATSCRVYLGSAVRGVPALGTIVRALTDGTARASCRGTVGRSLAVVPGVLLAMLPVLGCPACWPAYAGLLSSLGLSFLMDAAWLLPVTTVGLVLALFALGFRARRRRGFGPLVLGVLASAAILIGRFAVGVDEVVYAGATALVGASIWNVWPIRRQPESADTCGCVRGRGAAIGG
ncbi:MAG: MerC family mercury resistance protein [Phycisphaerae bacterium]|nr:MerC family mercury resistance protein [Phycisphaerae bacterium]